MLCTKINLKGWIAGLPPSYQSSLDKALEQQRGKSMNQKKYRVTLTEEERKNLDALTKKGKTAARKHQSRPHTAPCRRIGARPGLDR
jgi:hypothetical protein